MGEFFPAQVFKQLSHARAVIERHLAATLDTIHLFGSAIDGGLEAGQRHRLARDRQRRT